MPDTAVPGSGATAVGSPWFSYLRSDATRTVRLSVAADGRARQGSDRLVVVRGPVQAERILALVGRDRRLELIDHLPATLPAPVLDGEQS